MKIRISILIIFILLIFTDCEDTSNTENITTEQLNISILLDLSDRITPNIAPQQVDRDREIIKSVLDILKNRVMSKGTFQSEDKMNILFYPKPNDPSIANLASTLNFDLSELTSAERKNLFKNIDKVYDENLKKLYELALGRGIFDGSDIWRFFKDEINDKCIKNGKTYKNVLIILTDGYIYWKDTKLNDKNRFSYLLPTAQHVIMFRNKNNWENLFEQNDYGLIPANKELLKLNVLVLEVNPSDGHPEDFDILSKYISKWFDEMGINKNQYKILKTDLPVYIKPIIKSFFNNL